MKMFKILIILKLSVSPLKSNYSTHSNYQLTLRIQPQTQTTRLIEFSRTGINIDELTLIQSH